MPLHLRRRPTQRSSATPLRPEGGDGTPLSSVLLLLNDVPASPRRRAWNPGRRVRNKHHRIYGNEHLDQCVNSMDSKEGRRA